MLSEIEKKMLTSLQLQGYIGLCGSLTKKQRSDVLSGLVKKEYLTDQGELTKKAITEILQR